MAYVERGTDRLALHIYPEPDTSSVYPLVVLWPAMGVPARYYGRFAAELRDAGLAVVVVDLRGTGASTPRPDRRSGYGYVELAADVGAVLSALADRRGPDRTGRPTVLLGHSLGGQACALHLAASDSSTVDGLVLVAAGLPWWRLYPGGSRYGLLGYSQAIVGTSALLRVWPGWTFGGRQARGVMRDWGYTARHGRYPVHVGGDLATVRTPVLAVSVDGDRYTPPPVVDHFTGLLGTAPVTRLHYTTAEAGAPLDHFTWARAGRPLARHVAAFASAFPR